MAGTTEFGQVDPVEEIGRIAEEKDVFFHVDAAFGGFVIPFLEGCPLKFDFAVPGVSSIAIDPHKMGMSTIPSGGLLYRNEEPDAAAGDQRTVPDVPGADVPGGHPERRGSRRDLRGDEVPGPGRLQEHRRAVHGKHGAARRPSRATSGWSRSSSR